MTEPQNWVLIGVFTTIMLGGMTFMTRSINRTTTAAIDALDGKLGGRIAALDGKLTGQVGQLGGRIDALEGEVRGLRGEMNARFDAVGVRMDSLDKDVAALVKRVME